MAIDPNNLAGTAKLTFFDEFDGLSLWNGTSGTWNTGYNFNGYNVQTFSGNQELQYYINANDPNTASVDPWSTSNGILTITAEEADESIKPYIQNYDYTSGVLTSQYSFAQQYGYFEMSAKLPEGQGFWPAFWMMPTNGSWRPEIDVMEVLSSDTTTLWQFSHPADTSYDRYFKTTVPDLSEGFHRFGVDWQQDTLTFYFDGKVTGIAPTPPELNAAGPMYMIVNLAVGGSWGGPPDATTPWPAEMQIDYVRAYTAATGGGDPAPSYDGTSGDDLFAISPLTRVTITNYDVAGQDALRIPVGEGGFELSGYSGQSAFAMADVSAWWNNISGYQVLRWVGDAEAVNSTGEVDGVLQAMPGNAGDGVLMLAYTPDGKVGLYYDGDPAAPGRTSLVASFENLTDVRALNLSDFKIDGAAPPTTLAVGPMSVANPEGNTGVTAFSFTVTRSGDLSGESSASWAVFGSGSNPAFEADFSGGSLPSGVVNFAAGQTSSVVTVNVAGDRLVEADEGFTLSLANPTGASISTASAAGVITNDDAAASPPTLAIGPSTISQAEGNSGSTAFTFTVTRTGDLSAASSASWTTTGSGTNPAAAADFTGGALPGGTVTFAAGQALATIVVNAVGDTTRENDEGFTVALTNPTGAVLSTASASGVITNDDAAASPTAPTLAIGPSSVSQAEGNSGSTAFTFTVTRSGDLSAASSAGWTVAGSGANPAAAADFAGGTAPSGTVNFAAGQSSATIQVNVAGDTAVESNEGFTVTLANPTGATLTTASAAGVITNDDQAPAPAAPSLSIGPSSVSHNEGNSGSTAFTFTVTRSGDLSASSSASWSVTGSGANAASGGDFAGGSLPTGTVNFASGQSSATIAVNVAGDTTVEQTEGFTVTLANPTGASISTGTASGVITNDDQTPAPPAPTLSIGPSTVTLAEGNSGSTAFTYTVTRSGDLSASSSAGWSVTGSGANAASGGDFAGGSLPTGTVNFAAGQSSATIAVNVAGDSTVEQAEGFTVTLASPTGAVISTASASGVITNDDQNASGGVQSSTAMTGTSGDDVFMLSRSQARTVSQFDASGSDVLGVPVGSGGFSLAGLTAQQTTLNVVDVSAWWNNISGAQLVRWVGDPNGMDSLQEVDAVLNSMPGNGGGGVLVAAYTGDHQVGLYYDANPSQIGGAQMVITVTGMTNPLELGADDFRLFA